MKRFIFLVALLFAFLPFWTAKINAEEATPPASIKYDLAYPGILPDSPLYKIKVLRDKISAFLITDPQKKAEFYLLQTDKGILATAMLIDKNNIKLANETALKAENNFTLMTQEISKLSRKPSDEFFQRIKTAGLKHQEVINAKLSKIPKDQQGTFKNIITFSNMNLATIENYKQDTFYSK